MIVIFNLLWSEFLGQVTDNQCVITICRSRSKGRSSFQQTHSKVSLNNVDTDCKRVTPLLQEARVQDCGASVMFCRSLCKARNALPMMWTLSSMCLKVLLPFSRRSPRTPGRDIGQ